MARKSPPIPGLPDLAQIREIILELRAVLASPAVAPFLRLFSGYCE